MPALLLCVWLLRVPLLGPLVRAQIERAALKELGVELDIGAVRGSWLASLELHDVRTLQPGTRTQVRSIGAGRLRAEYSLLGLLRGDLEALHRIEGDDVAVELDLQQGAPSGGGGESSPLPPVLPELELRGLSLRVHDRNWDLQSPATDLDLFRDEPGTASRLHVQARGGRLSAAQQGWSAAELDAVLRYDAGRVELLHLLVDGRTPVREAWADLRRLHEGRAAFALDGDVFGGRLDAEATLAPQRIEVQGRIEEVDPRLPVALLTGLDAGGRLSAEGKWSQAGTRLAGGAADLELEWREARLGRIPLALVEARLRLADGSLRIEHLDAAAPTMRLSAMNAVIPLASGTSWRARVDAGSGAFVLTVDDVPHFLAESGLGGFVGAAEELPQRVALQARVAGGIAHFERAELWSEAWEARADGAELAFRDWSGGGVPPMTLPLTFTVRQPDVLLGSNAAPPCSGTLRGRVSGWEAELEELALRSVETSLQLEAPARVQFRPGSPLRFSDLRLRAPGARVQGSFALGPGGDVAVHARLEADDLAAAGYWLARADLPELQGSLQVDLELETMIPQPRFRLQASGAVSGAVTETVELRLAAAQDGTALVLEELRLAAPRATAGAHGRSDRPFTLADLEGGPEELARRWTGRVEMDAADVGALLAGLGRPGWSGGFAGTVDWERGSSAAATLTARGLAAPGELPLDADLAFAWDSERLRIEQGTLRSGEMQVQVEGSVPLALEGIGEGDLDLRARLEEADLDQVSRFLPREAALPFRSGKVEGALDLTGTWRGLRGAVDLRAHGLRPGSQLFLPDEPLDAEARLRFEGSGLTLETLQARSPTLELEASGHWEGVQDLPSLGDAAMDAHGTLKVRDLGWLAQRDRSLHSAGGAVELEVTAGGRLSAPELAGRFRLEHGRLRLMSPGLAPLTQVQVNGVLEGRTIRLEHVSGELGAAPFTAEGALTFVSGGAAELDLRLRGSELLLYRREGVKLRADADLHVHGPLPAVLVEGSVALTDGRLLRRIDLLGLSQGGGSSSVEGIELFTLEPPLDRVRFGVQVTSPQPFRVDTNMARGTVRPELRLEGTGAVPVLRGEIYVDETRVSLPATSVLVTGGVIRFLPANPYVPRLELSATARKLGYDINISVTGPYNQPVVTLSSVPPLPADQLLLLVVAGTPPADPFSSSSGTQAVGTVAVYLGQDLLARLTGDGSVEAEAAFLERFEVEGGRDVTQGGAETMEGRFRMFEDVLVEGDALYLVGERDAYDDFNLGLKIKLRFE
ncbi:MAG: hypothetical protein EYC70_10605 [Planctomycetota bacterium]|nr:MAG: hypothetical protein EYC70_10605 [Planctomycetota bacterium]